MITELDRKANIPILICTSKQLQVAVIVLSLHTGLQEIPGGGQTEGRIQSLPKGTLGQEKHGLRPTAGPNYMSRY